MEKVITGSSMVGRYPSTPTVFRSANMILKESRVDGATLIRVDDKSNPEVWFEILLPERTCKYRQLTKAPYVEKYMTSCGNRYIAETAVEVGFGPIPKPSGYCRHCGGRVEVTDTLDVSDLQNGVR